MPETLPLPQAADAVDRKERLRSRLTLLALLAPVLALAAYLRLAGLGNLQLYGDEAEYAIVARYLSRDLSFLAYPAIEGYGPVPFVSQPPLLLYVMAFSMKLLGPTDIAAVLPSALFGIGTVAAVFALGLRLRGRFIAFAAAGLLAVLPFHVEMSRKAQLDTGYVFFLVLTAYFLVTWLQSLRASLDAPDDAPLRRRARQHALGAGAAGAGAALAKLPGLLVAPVLILVLLLGLLLVVGKRLIAAQAAKEAAIQTGLGAAPMALGGLLYLGLLSYLGALTNFWLKLRWQLGRVDSSQATFQEVAAFQRPVDWYFTDPIGSFQKLFTERVLLLALVGGAFALYTFLRAPRKRVEHAVVPIMVIVVLSFFLWSDRKEGFYLLPFAPFIALWMAEAAGAARLALTWAANRSRPAMSRHVTPVAITLAALILVSPALAAAERSNDHYVNNETQQKYFGYGTKEAAALIHERDPNAAQYGTLLARFSLHWYNEQPSYHWYVDQTFIEEEIKSGHLRFIVYDDYLQLPHDREFMRSLIDRYGGEPIQTYREGWGDLTVFELHP